MKSRFLVFLVLAGLLLAACGQATPTPAATPPAASTLPADAATAEPTAAAPTGASSSNDGATAGSSAATDQSAGSSAAADQPYEITGRFTFTNDILLTYYVEHAVAMVDLYGFVQRDREWEVPVDSQTLGFLKLDAEQKTGEFDLNLPARPQGTLVDVNPDGREETGVQIFNVGYFPNLTGGPYSEGDDPSHGWLSYLASTVNDPENNDEITGGRLLVWSPDDEQFFPSGFGPDELLFTSDDPVMRVPAGYSVIDLDRQPFGVLRGGSIDMTLHEPGDISVKDFSDLSYKEAFDKMFEFARKEYAFNGIAGKQPDWDALYAELAPRVEQASAKKDAKAYYQALRDFTLAFNDGHVSVSGDIVTEAIQAEIAGGYGFAIRELNNGKVLVVHVVNGGPAANAGMKKGAEITEFNGQPILAAIEAINPASAPHSSDFAMRYEQARFLVRAPKGSKASVTFANPGEAPQTVELTTSDERQTLGVTSRHSGFDPSALPVEYLIANGTIGYVKLNSNYDDLNLIVRLFQRALKTFKENEIEILILDMRQNSGGANLGLAGFLTNNEIELGQLEYYSDKTGQFEPKREADTIKPNQEQFRFQKKFLLIDQACASACELEAYGFSKVPGMVVVGEYPTSGTEAEVARGRFKLPGGFDLRFPTGRFVLANGSLFLEGQGVQPTEWVRTTEETVLSEQDPVIQRVLELASR